MFVNYTNHNQADWGAEQIKEASAYGEIVYEPFPMVDPYATSEQVAMTVDREVDRIMKHNPSAVLCQGEMTMCFCVVQRLLQKNVLVLATTTKRPYKKSEFLFVAFREYINIGESMNEKVF